MGGGTRELVSRGRNPILHHMGDGIFSPGLWEGPRMGWTCGGEKSLFTAEITNMPKKCLSYAPAHCIDPSPLIYVCKLYSVT